LIFLAPPRTPGSKALAFALYQDKKNGKSTGGTKSLLSSKTLAYNNLKLPKSQKSKAV
jgi:hypothetical protein